MNMNSKVPEYERLLLRARNRVREAEQDLMQRKEWLQSLEKEFEVYKAQNKVTEGTTDTRQLLNG
jgi:hypothetical protein